MSTLLVIGGTGFFGKSILDSFQRGLLADFNISTIVVLARNTDKFKLEYPELCFTGVELINGDISNINVLPHADYVIHAANSTNMNDYFEGSDLNFKKAIKNYSFLALLFHSKSKILYCSSGAVYGKQALNILKMPEEQ
jgi:dTDP-glucose 4,6-dehydratase